MESEIIIEDAGKFKVLYNLPKDINVVVCIGGRGGRKTYEISKFIAKSAAIDKKRCIILRDEKELIRESILNDILSRYDSANEYGHLSLSTDRLDTGIKDKATGEMLVFTKGFRASTTAKRANLKGASNIDIAVIEEAEDIRDVDKFNTFADSIRKKGSLIIIVLNTPDIKHWVVERYFNKQQAKDKKGNPLDGFYKIIPKKIPGFMCIQASYLDNPYLPAHIISNYESYGDPDSHLYNPFYYYTAILGYASTGRKGQVLTKVQPISLKDYLALPYREYFGQDFGTASPAGLVGVKIHKNTSWCRQLNYKPMSTLDLAKLYCTLKFNVADQITADSADPKSISKLKNGYRGNELSDEDFRKYPALAVGWNVQPCIKGSDSINYGIDTMISMNLYAVEESTDLWNEILSYVYAQDKNKNYTDDPIDDFNHLIDPWRYVINKHRGRNYSGSTTS